MSAKANVNVVLTASEGAELSFADSLELSLNCFICQRTRRTVVLNVGKEVGICTPTEHLFPAKILSKEVLANANVYDVKYEIEYWFAPFVDTKFQESAKDILKWGRIGVQILCPKCGETKTSGVQNNIIRPWTFHCSCGQPLYFETEEYPKFEKGAFN